MFTKAIRKARNWLKFSMFCILALALIGSPVIASGHPLKGSTISSDWEINCVDCPKGIMGMEEHSLQLTTDGHPMIAFGFDHLYLALNDGGGWQIETVDFISRGGRRRFPGSGHKPISSHHLPGCCE